MLLNDPNAALKVKNFTKSMIQELRLKGAPFLLDKTTVVVGPMIVKERAGVFRMIGSRKYSKHHFGSMEIAVTIAQLLRRNGIGDEVFADKLVLLDEKISSKRFGVFNLTRILKALEGPKKTIIETKINQEQEQLTSFITQARKLIQSTQLN